MYDRGVIIDTELSKWLSESSPRLNQEASPMLSKCANPACLARFHYLHQGRIFKIERSPSGEKIAYVRMFAGTVRARDRLRLFAVNRTCAQ